MATNQLILCSLCTRDMTDCHYDDKLSGHLFLKQVAIRFERKNKKTPIEINGNTRRVDLLQGFDCKTKLQDAIQSTVNELLAGLSLPVWPVRPLNLESVAGYREWKAVVGLRQWGQRWLWRKLVKSHGGRWDGDRGVTQRWLKTLHPHAHESDLLQIAQRRQELKINPSKETNVERSVASQLENKIRRFCLLCLMLLHVWRSCKTSFPFSHPLLEPVLRRNRKEPV